MTTAEKIAKLKAEMQQLLDKIKYASRDDMKLVKQWSAIYNKKKEDLRFLELNKDKLK